MSIRSNIEAIIEEIGNGNTALGDELRSKSTAAIIAGAGTPEWTAYMTKFSQSPEQLARLLPTDNTIGEEAFDVARTYLVANGMCGSDTTGTTTLITTVGDQLDEENP